MSKEEALRQRVYKFYQNHKEKGKVYTVKHFMDEGEKRSTIYDIISREQSGLGAQRVIGSGRIAKKMPIKKVKNLQKLFNHKDNISQRQAANKFQCHQSYISKILKNTKIWCN
ncbi:hypothetical protein ABPG72_021753 [Tetrahymena utriculariae]